MAVKAKAEITLYKIISVDKVVRYYLLQSSTLTAPSKPADGAVIGSNWSKTEPSYTSGSTSTLYFVDQTVLSNGALKYSEVSKSSSYEAAKEAWNKANNAQKTANDAIADTYQEYYLSASQTALSGGSWSTTAPTWVNGKYMWSRTVKVDGAGNKTYTPSQNGVCIAGAKGDTGASGKGIKSTAIAYQLSASQTKAPTGTWLSSPPKTDIATPYLWTRTVITYTDNTTSTSYGVSSTWTPALEDLKTRISDAETAISNNAKEIKLKASRDEVTDISDNLKVLTKTSTEFKQTVEGWQLNWDKLISTDNAEVASHQDYITFDKGDIILGESSNDLKLKITNDSIQFKGTSNTEVTPDSDATAWITGKTFHISDGEIQNSLKFGKLYLKPNNENNSVDLYYSDSESDVISGSYVRLGQTISMGNGMGSGFLKLNTGCIQMYPTTLADTIGNGNTGKFELHAGGSYPYIIFGDYNTNDEAKKEKGRYSVRIGGSNTVSGNCSVAIGYSSDVSGKNSTAIGHYLKNISDNQLLIGKYNISSDYPFIIGNGSSDTERSNALTVDWDGNITGKSLTSANDLKLGFGSSNIFKPYFTKGDSITLTIYAVGYVTTGGKEVAMYVPLSRPIIAGGSVSVASVNGLTIRQNGKYLYSSSASNSVNPSSFRAAIVGSGCGVNIVATFGNTVNATVNDVCSITASIKITFS
nr:MAG TPA: tail protein [Caudoviricetes sp.]